VADVTPTWDPNGFPDRCRQQTSALRKYFVLAVVEALSGMALGI
jgi:hypothetical protein